MTSRRPDWCGAVCAVLPNVIGQRVLVLTEDPDPWWDALYARNAAEITVVVGTTTPRGDNPWPDHRVRYMQLGVEWPSLGEFDLVLCVGLYPLWYSLCGDHDRIWQWLAVHARPRSGTVAWVAATDIRNPYATAATQRLGGYKRKFIEWAAQRVFARLVPQGPGPTSYSEVWFASGRQEVVYDRSDGQYRGGDSLPRTGQEPPRADGRGGAGGRECGGVVAVLRDAEHPECSAAATPSASPGFGDGERPLVAGVGGVRAGGDAPGGAPPPAPRLSGGGDRGTDQPADQLWVVRWGCAVLPPEHPEWGLVLGGGANVWEDVLAWEAVYGRQWDGLVVAVNDVGCHWPRDLHHWVSLHPEKFTGWLALRMSYGHSTGHVTWGRAGRIHSEHHLRAWAGGSSGMYGIQVAQHVGCTRVILCGIPMTATQHFAESTVHVQRQPWTAVAGHWRAWEAQAHRMQGWVKSMSGRSQEMLGAPTLEWLYGPAL